VLLGEIQFFRGRGYGMMCGVYIMGDIPEVIPG